MLETETGLSQSCHTQKNLGLELKSKLLMRRSCDEISKWAFEIYTKYGLELEHDLDYIVLKLMTMEEGPEFEISIEELHKLADKLITEGDKEELSKPISEIPDRAMDLGENWLMCPLCQEAWESHFEYVMVFCPKCNKKTPQSKSKI